MISGRGRLCYQRYILGNPKVSHKIRADWCDDCYRQGRGWPTSGRYPRRISGTYKVSVGGLDGKSNCTGIILTVASGQTVGSVCSGTNWTRSSPAGFLLVVLTRLVYEKKPTLRCGTLGRMSSILSALLIRCVLTICSRLYCLRDFRFRFGGVPRPFCSSCTGDSAGYAWNLFLNYGSGITSNPEFWLFPWKAAHGLRDKGFRCKTPLSPKPIG